MTQPPRIAEIVKFEPEKADPEVVGILEDLLEDAKSGALRSLVVIGERLDDQGRPCAFHQRVGYSDQIATIGYVTVLLHSLSAEVLSSGQ